MRLAESFRFPTPVRTHAWHEFDSSSLTSQCAKQCGAVLRAIAHTAFLDRRQEPVLTPMRNYNLWAISCVHSALTARLSHLLIQCNEKLHFLGFWNRSSDLCRFLFQELCYGIRLLMRSIYDLSIACNLSVRLSPNRDKLCQASRLRVFVEWKRYPYVPKMKMGVKFTPSQLDGRQSDIYEVLFNDSGITIRTNRILNFRHSRPLHGRLIVAFK